MDGCIHPDLPAREQDIAAAAIDRALTLNPNAALAWAARGFVLSRRGQSNAAIEACERGMRLSPLDPLRRVFTTGMALAHTAAGRYEEALDWVVTALLQKAHLCAHLDRTEEARGAVRQLLEAQPWHTIAGSQRRLSRVYGPELAATRAEALRKAGLPEE